MSNLRVRKTVHHPLQEEVAATGSQQQAASHRLCWISRARLCSEHKHSVQPVELRAWQVVFSFLCDMPGP